VKTQPTRVASRKKRVREANLAMGGQIMGPDAPTLIQLHSYISSRTMPPALVPKYVV
jgi:hypothetical protein